jgi:ribosomal-protein-alanine N-acetyltransferase
MIRDKLKIFLKPLILTKVIKLNLTTKVKSIIKQLHIFSCMKRIFPSFYKPPMNKLIETERLYFRELQASDDQNIFNLDSDAEVHRYLGNKPLHHIEQARDVIKFIRQQYIDYGIGRLAIIEKETNDFIGWGGFKLITDVVNGHQNYYDLGYRLLRKHWGKGYATESSKAAVDYAFNQLKLRVVYGIADMKNLSSQKVLAKCGFSNVDLFDYDAKPHYWFELRNPGR